jgi:excisionase family DNA binding protein
MKKPRNAPILQQPVIEPRLLNVKQTAQYLSVKIWFVRNLIYEKKVRVLRLGRGYCFDRADLDAWIEAQKAAA